MNQNSQSPKNKRILIILLCVVLAALLALGIFLLVRNSKLNQQNDDLTAAYEQAATQLAELEQSAAQPAQELTALQTEYDAYKADAQAVKEADEQALASLQTAFDTYQTDTDATLAGLRQANAGLQTELDTLKAAATGEPDDALTALQAEYNAYRTQAAADLAAASEETATLQTALDSAQAAASADLAALQSDFDAYKTQSEADLAEAATKLTALQTELAALTAGTAPTGAPDGTDETDATAALAALQGEFDAYKASAASQLAALQTEFDTYKANAQAEQDAAVTAGVADAQTAADTSAQALAALQAEFDTYKADAAGQLTALQTEFDTYKAQAAEQLTALQENFDTYKATTEATLATAQQETEAAVRQAAESAIPTDTNGAANQANGNLAVFYKGNIYYNNNYQSGNIYVENAAGYGDVYLRRTSSGDVNMTRNIAAVENGGLFYLNSNRLYRLDLETGESTFMKNNMDLYSDSAMTIYDDRIYFLKALFDAAGEPADNFYLVDFRCNNLENVPGVSAYAFVGEGRTVYYVEAGTYNIVKYDLVDQTGSAIYQANGSKITCLTLADGMLYFCADGQLTAMQPDGSGALAVDGVKASSVNVIGGWIYYSNLDDSEKIYRITTGGEYNELICDVPNTCCLNVAGDWLFFMQYQGTGDQRVIVDTYKVKLDGTGLTLAKP